MAIAMTTGTVGGHAGEFIPVHRQENDTPVALTLTMTLPMSLEDVTAALWFLVADYPRDELDDVLGDPPYLHRLVLESAHCAGFDELESVRLGFADIEPGTLAHEFLTLVRTRVADLYGPPRPRRARSCETAGRREFAGVS
jgi:hypothetical protein